MLPSEAKLGAADLILSCGSIEVQLLHSLCLTCSNRNIYKKVNESNVKYLQLVTLIHSPRLSILSCLFSQTGSLILLLFPAVSKCLKVD